MVYYKQITTVNGFINQPITGGHHIVELGKIVEIVVLIWVNSNLPEGNGIWPEKGDSSPEVIRSTNCNGGLIR